MASFLIDVDHVYLFIKENVNFLDFNELMKFNEEITYQYINNKNTAFLDSIYIFHTIEVVGLLFLMSGFNPVLRFITYGLMFHIITDIIHHFILGFPIWRWLSLIRFIQINWFN